MHENIYIQIIEKRKGIYNESFTMVYIKEYAKSE